MLKNLLTSRRVAIVGSREFSALSMVVEFVSAYFTKGTVLVSGGARGVDKTAEEAAIAIGCNTRIYKPDWTRYGSRAAFLRNQLIVDDADLVVSFWDGKSHGTQDTMRRARDGSIPSIEFVVHKDQ